MRRYGKQPPAQLEQLGQDLGFGRKERAKLITEYGEETLRVKWTKAWLSVHVERPKSLHRNPACPPTTRLDNALRDGEMVDDATTLRFAKEAEERMAVLHAEERAKKEDRSLVNTLREARIRARKKGVDVTDETAKVRAALDEMRKKLGEAA